MEVCVEHLSKDMFLNKMKHAVKYDVYLNMLLMGSIYVINKIYIVERNTNFRSNNL